MLLPLDGGGLLGHLADRPLPLRFARGKDGQLFEEGTEVRIAGRDNITWLVENV